MKPDDEAIVLACRRGDESAWESLVMRYQRLIISIPRRAGLDEDSCSDVFQSVFASLIERLDRIEHPDRIQAWLVTTARRETWRMIRSRKAQRAAAGEDEEDEIDRIPDDAPLADEVLIELEQQHQIRMALESVDERCRKLIELLFYRADAPAYSEIASMLKLPEGSIGPTRARCLQKLLHIIRKMEI
jgi:RNA polymerase sigma factor (sigma-70 family)